MARALAEGFAYQGEKSFYRNNEFRGEKSSNLSPLKFINFIQNHDQIGNRALGERISLLTDIDSIRAASCLYLLAPSIPLIYMGEEWGSKTPFYFFCNFNNELSQAITRGRRDEFSKFPQFNDPEIIKTIPDPGNEKTFFYSKLNWSDLENVQNQKMLDFYKNLLKIRKEHIIPIIKNIEKSKFNVINDKAFQVKWALNNDKKLTVMANFGEESVKIKSSFKKENILMISNFESKDFLIDQKILMPKTVCWVTDPP
jgi:1,4-alpha-glucan branching enzyme/maltooligosyltrehalose trehalohydrolase